MSKIIFEKGLYGIRAILTDTWESSFLNLLLKKNVVELELNMGKGWRGDNLDFLQFLPNLKSLIILDFRIKSIKGIFYLKELYTIDISTYCETPIDFSYFPNLINCTIEWRKGSESLFNVVKLESLAINNYKGKNSSVFSKLINLKELTIMNSSLEDLKGLSPLTNLKYLRLTNLNKIKTLDGIENLNKLEILNMQRCMWIDTIQQVFSLHRLKQLMITDMTKIKTILGIESLKDLEMFMFFGSTNIEDGDLTPILKLEKLKAISYRNRRHYTHKREFFGDAYYQGYKNL